MDVTHIYGQSMWHGEAFVCGTPADLARLREAIDEALTNGSSEMKSFTNDGEGYSVHVVVATAEQAEQLKLPYTDEVAVHKTEYGPWSIMSERR